VDYHITVQGEQKGPYSLSQIQSMWESGTITSDSLYWNTEAKEWNPIKELLESQNPPLPVVNEPPAPVLKVSPPPVINAPLPPVLNQPIPPKSKSRIPLLSIVVLIGLVAVILVSMSSEIGSGKGVKIVEWSLESTKQSATGSVYANWKFHLKNESNIPKHGQLWLYGKDKDGFQCYKRPYQTLTRIPPKGEIKKIEEVFFTAEKDDLIETWEIVWKQY
jgi:hypothetical protein